MNAQLSVQNMAEEMLARQVRKIHVIAWRDFDDAEAGDPKSMLMNSCRVGKKLVCQ